MKDKNKTFRLRCFSRRHRSALLLLCCVTLLQACNKTHDESTDADATSPSQLTSKAEQQPEILVKDDDLILLESLKQDPGKINHFEVRADAVKAVAEIGERRDVSAIPLLLDGMFTIQPFVVDNALEYQAAYPCTAALIKIGESAVLPLQERVLASANRWQQLVLLGTLCDIKGKKFVSDWLVGLQKTNKVTSLSQENLVELNSYVVSLSR